jgi:hypothetical protein
MLKKFSIFAVLVALILFIINRVFSERATETDIDE